VRVAACAVMLDETHQTSTVELGNHKFHVAHDYTFGWSKRSDGPWPRTGGKIISITPDEFFVAGSGVIVTCELNTPGDRLRESAGSMKADLSMADRLPDAG
jgi:hypothetical protein